MNALDILSYVMLWVVIILGIVIMIWGTIKYRSIYNPSYEELFGDDDHNISNCINNLTIQEALDIVDKKVEGRNNA